MDLTKYLNSTTYMSPKFDGFDQSRAIEDPDIICMQVKLA